MPVELSRIHDALYVSNLRKYMADPSHVLKASELEVRENLAYAELSMRIIDRKEQVLRSKPMVGLEGRSEELGCRRGFVEGQRSYMDSISISFHFGYVLL